MYEFSSVLNIHIFFLSMNPSKFIPVIVNDCSYAHLVEVEGRWLEPYDGDIVLVVSEEIREETQEDSSHLLIHQLFGASLLEAL